MFSADTFAMPALGLVTVQEYGSSARANVTRIAWSRRKPSHFRVGF